MASAPPAGTTGLTYADLLELPGPEESGGLRFELLDGELLVTPAPALRHQRSVMRVAVNLVAWTDEHGGEVFPAPTDVWFADDTVFEPDVLVIRGDDPGRLEERRIVGPPDLVVEVSSPSTRRTDLVRKRRVYEREGVAEFWFVDLDVDQVQCYRLGDDGSYGPPEVVLPGGELVSGALPGCAMPATDALQPPGDS